MPLQAGVKRKYKNNDDKYYTKSVNDSSKKTTKQLPKKSKVTKPSQQKKPANAYTDTATKAAQTIKNNVEGKKGGLKKSSVSTSGYVQKTTKANNVAKTIAQRQWDNEKGHSYKTDSKENIGRTGANPNRYSHRKIKPTVKERMEDSGLYVNKVDTTPRVKKEDSTPTRKNDRNTSQKKPTNRNNYNKHRLDEGAKDIQNRGLSGALEGNNAFDKAFNPMGKFISNAMDSTIDNSLLGAGATLATGKKITDGAYYDNPYEAQRHQGISAGAGRMAGLALNYGLMRSAVNPQLTKAADAVMNGTKVGNLIKGSSALGKIGQAVGTKPAQDIATGLVKEAISDATLGFGQNAIINYGEGLRGKRFWEQQAKDTALDFAIGGIMEGVGIGKEIRKAGKDAEAILGRSVTENLKNAKTKEEYAESLRNELRDLINLRDSNTTGRQVAEASESKINDLMAEYRKALNMNNQQFNRLKAGRDINTKYYDVRKGREDLASARAKVDNKPKESALEAEADAKSFEDFIKTPSKEAINEAKEQGIRDPKSLKEFWRNRKMQGFTQSDAKELTKEEATDILYAKTDRGVMREWFTNYDSNIKPKIEDAILNDKELRNAGLNLAYHNFKEFDFKGANKDISFDEFLDTPITLYRGKHSKGLIDDDAFVSFTPDLETARHLGDKGEEIVEITVTPRETFGTYDINGEQEYFVPRKLYDEQTPKAVETNSANKAAKETPRVDSPDSTAYNNIKGEETNGRKNTQPLQEGNLQQGTAKGDSGSESLLQGERPRNAGDLRVEPEGRSRASGDIQVSEGHLVDEKTDNLLRTDKKIAERTAKNADSIEEFGKRLDENRKGNEYGYCVSPVESSDGNTRYFTTHEGKVTAGVHKDGNIVALSKSSDAGKNVNSHEALMTAIGMGGDRCDAYGIRLAQTYQRYGLVPVARVPFDENVVREYFRPEEVDDALAMFRKMKDTGNEPDVYFFAKFDDLENTIKTRDAGGYKLLSEDELRKLPEMDYESAEKYRNQLLDNSSKRNAYMKEHGIDGVFTEAKRTEVKGANRPTKRLNKKAETVAEEVKPKAETATVVEEAKPKAETATAPKDKSANTGNGDLPQGKKLEKVGEFEVVGSGKGVETTTPSETNLPFIERFKKTYRKARKDLINSEAGLERMDKVAAKQTEEKIKQIRSDKSLSKAQKKEAIEKLRKQRSETSIQERSYMARNAKGQTGYILDKKLVNRKGEEIGESLSKMLGGEFEYNGKKYKSPYADEETGKLFDEYAMELHNTYRAKQGKNIYGGRDYEEEVDQIIKHYPALAGEKDRLLKWLNDTDGTTTKEQRKALEERLRNKYLYEAEGKDGKKEMKSSIDDVIKDLNEYRAAKSQARVDKILESHPEFKKVTENMDEWWKKFTDEYLVGSGIISKDDMAKFREIYPHYVPTFRDMGELAGKETKNAANLIKKATGSGKRTLLTVPEQYAHQIDRMVTAARRNELNQEIIETLRKDPEGLKMFGAVQGKNGKFEVDFETGDLEDLITSLDEISVKQVKSGKNTITAVIDGQKVSANVSDEVAKSLEAMSNLQDTNLIVKIGKTITNPMKFTITGGNPVFFVSNMMRDLPTLYIQSNHGMVRTTIGLAKATKEVLTNGEKYQIYKALGGAESGYYMRGKGFDTSGNHRGIIQKAQSFLSAIGERGEAIPRMAEFINTLEKTGDPYKALRDAAESTVDFSRRGSSDVAQALDAWTLYLNAGAQGLDKFARTIKAHPLRTAGRSMTMLGVPYLALNALNYDNPHYQDLTERVKQNNFLIPNLAGEKDEEGNCMTFIKVPLNREYGTVFAASLYCTLKAVRGEDNSWEGFRETFSENFLPNNPLTDNILAPLLINIPQNKDFAGRSIIPTALKDVSPENQFDYDTSEFAKLVASGMNKIPVKDVPIVKYLQSPKLVDYILDSYTGYYGQALQSATTTGGTSKENYAEDVLVKQTLAQPFLNKFKADARYSSKPVADLYTMKDEYAQKKADAEANGETWSEAHAAESALYKISKGIYESTAAEKEILADKSLTKAEKDKMVAELRTARNELARDAQKEVDAAIKEYREAPTFSAMSETTKEKWNSDIGMKKEDWAKVYQLNIDEYNAQKEKTGTGTTADEKRMLLLENGVTTYKQAQSILGENTSKKKWDEAVALHKNGKTLADVKAEEEKIANMTKEQKSFYTHYQTRANTRYSESKNVQKTISKKTYDDFIYESQYVDKNTNNNGSITKAEAKNIIENMDKMYGLTKTQKACLWYLAGNDEGWKEKPYGNYKP